MNAMEKNAIDLLYDSDNSKRLGFWNEHGENYISVEYFQSKIVLNIS